MKTASIRSSAFAAKPIKMIVLSLTALLAVGILATAAVAADPRETATSASGAAGAGEPTGGSAPNLDINQAELLEKNSEQLPVHPELLDVQRAAPSPLMVRINAVNAAAADRLAELQVRLDASPDNLASLEIIRAMEQVKVRTEQDILAVQAAYARETGREDLAVEIEGALTELTAPRPVRQPADRPAPAAGNR